jgi:hypothetical protein
MKESNKNLELIKIDHFLLCKLFLLGMFLAEVILMLKVIVLGFQNNSIHNQKEIWFWIILVFYFPIIGYYLIKNS